MSNLESLKDVRTIASFSALIGLGISTAYFSNEISKIKEEQKEIKDILAEMASHVSPDTPQQLDNFKDAIRKLDVRLAKTQHDVKIIIDNTKDKTLFQNEDIEQDHNWNLRTIPVQDLDHILRSEPLRNYNAAIKNEKEEKRVYKRLTTRSKPSIPETDPDIDDDIAKMME